MVERFIEFHLEAPDGLFWEQLKIFYDSAGIEKDIDGTAEEYPDIEWVDEWKEEILESQAEAFKKILPNFGIRVASFKVLKQTEIPPFLRKAA